MGTKVNVSTSLITDSAVTTSKINNLAVTSAKIATGNVTATQLGTDAVETVKIKNLNVTVAKLATDSVETVKIKNLNVTAGKLAVDSVETSKIKALNVTRPKLVAVGQQIATVITSSWPAPSTSFTDMPNQSITITSTGRPIIIGVTPQDPDTNGPGVITCGLNAGGSSGKFYEGFIQLVRDTTNLAIWKFGGDIDVVLGPATFVSVDVPCSVMSTIDAIGAGTYTYKLEARKNPTEAFLIANNISLYAYEL